MECSYCAMIRVCITCNVVKGDRVMGVFSIFLLENTPACREGFTALNLRITKLFEDLSLAKGGG